MSPANYSSFSVRNGTLALLTAEGLGYRLGLNPRTVDKIVILCGVNDQPFRSCVEPWGR